VRLKSAVTDEVIAQTNTDADGFVTFTANGSPGPTYLEATINGQTRRRYGSVAPQVGNWYAGEWDSFMFVLSDGIVPGLGDELPLEPQSGMTVQLGTGGVLLQGLLFRVHEPEIFTIPENSAGNPRVDLLSVRFDVAGPYHGRAQLVAIQGTPAANPVAPTPQATETQIDYPISTIRVANGAGAITPADITLLGSFANSFIGPGAVGTDQLAQNAVTASKLDTGSVTNGKILDSAITVGKLNPSVYAGTGTAVTLARSDHNHDGTYAPTSHTHSASQITSGTLAIARIPTGTTSTTVALGNHTHTGVYAPASHTHTASQITDFATAVQAASPEAVRYIKSGGSTVVMEHADRLNFGTGLLTTQSSAIPSQADVQLDFGSGSSQVAAGNHNHDGVYAPTSHNHSASQITSGTLAIARIPTGTSSSTVAVGNHAHTLPVMQRFLIPVKSNPLVSSSQTSLSLLDTTVTLTSGIDWQVRAWLFITVRNNVNNGVFRLGLQLGETSAYPEEQIELASVGGVPIVYNWVTTRPVNGGGSMRVRANGYWVSGDPSDIRTGYVLVEAFPAR